MQKRVYTAFTLIELLVVIAIIAILAAILFPVFAQARAKARQAACLSNMKQIGLAIIQYNQDYDELMPASENYPTGNSTNGIRSWPSLVFSYVKSQDVFVCPGANDAGFKPDARLNNTSPNRTYFGVTDPKAINPATTDSGDGSTKGFGFVDRLSYGRNLIPAVGTSANPAWSALTANRATNTGKTYQGFVNYPTIVKCGFVGSGANGIGTGTTTSISIAEIQDIAGTIHIVDAIAGGNISSSPNNDGRLYGGSIRGIQQDTRTDMFNDAEPSKVDYRHSGGFNALYGDGHSGWKKWGSTTPCMWTIQDDQCN